LFGLLFVADNFILFSEYELKKLNMIIYTIALLIMFNFQIQTTFEKITNQSKFFVQLLLSLIGGVILCIYGFKLELGFKNPVIIIVFFYMLILVLSILFSLFSFIKYKSICSKYFLLTISTLFISDILFAINKYYYESLFLLIISCVIEVFIYYFLLIYLIKKEIQLTN